VKHFDSLVKNICNAVSLVSGLRGAGPSFSGGLMWFGRRIWRGSIFPMGA